MSSTSAPCSIGAEGPTTRKTVYQRALARTEFSHDSSHNDENAKRFGYPGALVSAYVLTGLMSEPMVTFFGASWFTTGSISLTFIGKGVQQGDSVSCRSVVKSVEPVESRLGAHRVVLDVWMEKDDGVKAVIGEASAILEDLD